MKKISIVLIVVFLFAFSGLVFAEQPDMTKTVKLDAKTSTATLTSENTSGTIKYIGFGFRDDDGDAFTVGGTDPTIKIYIDDFTTPRVELTLWEVCMFFGAGIGDSGTWNNSEGLELGGITSYYRTSGVGYTAVYGYLVPNIKYKDKLRVEVVPGTGRDYFHAVVTYEE